MHEPWAPSAGSVALRHSRALNVGSFHAPAERVLSTQVARKFVELFFGRMDARTASYEATRGADDPLLPGELPAAAPRGDAPRRRAAHDGPLRIAFSDREERGALRLFLRALRRLPEDLPWEAVVYSKTGAMPTLRSSLRNRVTVVDDEDAAFAGADIVVAASLGQVTAPGVLVKALGAGAVPLAARVPVYEEVLREGDLGPALPARRRRRCWPRSSSARSATTPCARSCRGRRARRARSSRGRSVADQVEAIYTGLAALRHDPDPKPEVRARVAKHKLIDVDLHMHTDHSHDCATPVDVLLATARRRRPGRDRGHRPQRDLRRARRAPRRPPSTASR